MKSKSLKNKNTFSIFFVFAIISLTLLSSCSSPSNNSTTNNNPTSEVTEKENITPEMVEEKTTTSDMSEKETVTPEMVEEKTTTSDMSEKETVTPEMVEEKTTTSDMSEYVDHNVDIDPIPLSDSDKELTLEGYGAKGALADKDLTINDMLQYAVEDEYLAHGEYLAIIEKFGSQKPYTNIVKAEETHLAYLKEIYLAYELDFPMDKSKDHIIVPKTLLEAAETGVQAEIDNIAMYENFLSYTLPENIFEVFTALKSGSDSHLLAFQKQVNKLK